MIGPAGSQIGIIFRNELLAGICIVRYRRIHQNGTFAILAAPVCVPFPFRENTIFRVVPDLLYPQSPENQIRASLVPFVGLVCKFRIAFCRIDNPVQNSFHHPGLVSFPVNTVIAQGITDRHISGIFGRSSVEIPPMVNTVIRSVHGKICRFSIVFKRITVRISLPVSKFDLVKPVFPIAEPAFMQCDCPYRLHRSLAIDLYTLQIPGIIPGLGTIDKLQIPSFEIYSCKTGRISGIIPCHTGICIFRICPSV